MAPGHCSGAQAMADANAGTSPGGHVAVGYPVQQIEHPWPVLGNTQGRRGSAVHVHNMKTLIVLVFIVASVQISLQFLCAVYLQEANKQMQVYVHLSNRTVAATE